MSPELRLQFIAIDVRSAMCLLSNCEALVFIAVVIVAVGALMIVLAQG